MAGTPDHRLLKLGPWPRGVNNLADEGSLPMNEFGSRPIALREADNIDFDRMGWPKRRRGATRLFTGTLVHSVWSDPQLAWALFVDDGELHALHEDQQVQPLGVTVGPRPVSYARINDRIVWSNGSVRGLLTLDLQAHDWAPEQPGGQPDVAVAAGLSLDPGRYQVAVTFVDALGRESGSTLAVALEVPASTGIAVSNLPQPMTAAGINVYLTGANDQVLRLHSQVPAGVAALLLGAPALGRVLTTQFLSPLPPGQIVRYFNGRQLVAVDDEVLWSEPLRYGLFHRARNRIRFADRVDLMEPVGDGSPGAGLFVAAGQRTYWLGGADPKDFSHQIAYGHGAVPRTATAVAGTVLGVDTAETLPVWLSRNGYFCIGVPGGNVQPLKQGEAALDGADSGAALFRACAGLQQLLVTLRAPYQQGLAVTDRAVAHVIHRDP